MAVMPVSRSFEIGDRQIVVGLRDVQVLMEVSFQNVSHTMTRVSQIRPKAADLSPKKRMS